MQFSILQQRQMEIYIDFQTSKNPLTNPGLVWPVLPKENGRGSGFFPSLYEKTKCDKLTTQTLTGLGFLGKCSRWWDSEGVNIELFSIFWNIMYYILLLDMPSVRSSPLWSILHLWYSKSSSRRVYHSYETIGITVALSMSVVPFVSPSHQVFVSVTNH